MSFTSLVWGGMLIVCVACMPASRHYQGPDAALKIWTDSRSKSILIQMWLFANEVVQTKARGFIATGVNIVRRETPLALYKGLGAVLSGIVPKMAIRFASFETYKGWLADKSTGKTSVGNIFIGTSQSPLCRLGIASCIILQLVWVPVRRRASSL